MLKFLLSMSLFVSATMSMTAQTVQSFIQKGIQLHDASKFAEAISQFEAAIKIEPKNSTAHYEMANTYLAMEKYNETIDHAEKSLKFQKYKDAEAYTLIGTAYDMLGNPKKAVKAYEDGIKMNPKQYNLYYNLAITQYNQKEFDKAETAVMGSIKNNPKHANSHFLLANLQLSKDKRIKAMLPFYMFLCVQPNDKRAPSVRTSLDKLFNKGVSVDEKDDKSITISLAPVDDKEEFGIQEMTLSLMSSLEQGELSKVMDSLKIVTTPQEKFNKTTKMFFELLSDKEDKKKSKKSDSFWQTSYVNVFNEILENGHLEAFCHSINGYTSEGIKNDVQKWQKDNPEKVVSYKIWMEGKGLSSAEK